jgi:four helix bundle protein
VRGEGETDDGKITDFRDLRVWKLGIALVVDVYRLTATFPRHELYGLAGQMQRAAVSVPSNIAEGHTREHIKEYLHHIAIARASLAEVHTQLVIAAELGYVPADQAQKAMDQAMSLKKRLAALRNALTRRVIPHP